MTDKQLINQLMELANNNQRIVFKWLKEPSNRPDMPSNGKPLDYARWVLRLEGINEDALARISNWSLFQGPTNGATIAQRLSSVAATVGCEDLGWPAGNMHHQTQLTPEEQEVFRGS